ncbi:MAG: glycosyltransferase family 4 protein [Planctomycetes bacterium]|nr:glycosyltransferase family 4 protein [Planctomycetota bacterium]
MHILYIHQYFATPNGNTGTRSYEFARRWVQAGHKVTMLTSVAQLTPADLGDVPQGGTVRLNVDGISVIALDIPYEQSMGVLGRLWAFLKFMVKASWCAMWCRGVDVMYVTSTPLTVGVPALVARWLRGRKYVFEVRDLWPAVPVALGYLRNPLLIWMVKRFERLIYRSASALIALSPGAAKAIRADSGPKKTIEVIPNCADLELFAPDLDGASVRHKLGWDGCFVCFHTGTMGSVNGLDVVVRAAEHHRSQSDIRFVLIGEGKEKEHLRQEKERLGLANLEILDGVPKKELPALIAAGDLGLMTVTPIPVLEHNSANKFFDYLSAGKPILLNYGGWQRELLEREEAGWGCDMNDEKSFFGRIGELKNDPAACQRMGTNARSTAESKFSRDLLAAQALELTTRIAAR